RLSETLHHRPQQIRTRLLQVLAYQLRKPHTGHVGHRVLRSFDELLARFEGSTRWPSQLRQHAERINNPYTTLVDANLDGTCETRCEGLDRARADPEN